MFQGVDDVIASVGAIQFLQQDHNVAGRITSVAESIQARAAVSGSAAAGIPNSGDIRLWSLNDISF